MSLLLWGLTLGTIGKILLGVTVLLVHTRISEEHKIDQVVLKSLRRERILGIAGIFLMLIGYVLEMLFYTTGTGF